MVVHRLQTHTVNCTLIHKLILVSLSIWYILYIALYDDQEEQIREQFLNVCNEKNWNLPMLEIMETLNRSQIHQRI